MSFPTIWEDIYRNNTHLSIWPWSDMVSYVMRYARPTGPAFRVLEIGVGAGANVPFFRSLNTDYYAVDGSATIIAKLQERFSDIAGNFRVADFSKDLVVEGMFDLIVDRGAMTSNTETSIRACLKLVHQKLKPGGKFISIDMYSSQHSDYALGTMLEDIYTKTDLEEGQLRGVGPIHFSDEAHMKSLFQDFEIEIMEHKIVQRLIPENSHRFASFNTICRKRG